MAEALTASCRFPSAEQGSAAKVVVVRWPSAVQRISIGAGRGHVVRG